MSLSQYILMDELSRQTYNQEKTFMNMKIELENIDNDNEGLENLIQDMQKIKQELGEFRGKEFVSFGF